MVLNAETMVGQPGSIPSETATPDDNRHATTAGQYGGADIRTDEGHLRLTAYEATRLRENRTQPAHDREIVLEAGLDDLDADLVDEMVKRLTSGRSRAFQGLTRDECLHRLNIARTVDGQMHPTLAGLLACGRYPQQFFPQLGVTLAVIPTPILGEPGAVGERFVANQTIEGALPDIIADTTTLLVKHFRPASIISGAVHTGRLEYPPEVVRELLVNALVHRDYSPGSRGTSVQVELYPDRLVIRNPGGFYGPVDPKSFGEPDVSSSRNAVLARLLSDLPGRDGQLLAENRGSGIPTVVRTLGRAGMTPPSFKGTLSRVEVTVTRQALLDPPTQQWITALNQEGLTSRQSRILAFLTGHGTTSAREIATEIGVSYVTALNDINVLLDAGALEATAPPRSKNRRYRLTTQEN